ncbi:putative uncharacterized protein encoded by MAPKAPK5-AS1 [Macaca thibetana thibetana]|uniref:putative uncharacterized protein encoded by MAPKAPK5-AS1 n=1 Tax=Macaca thibetana thibetana TaxID=257877 RepID=UPI0021BC52D5|nr:putative uncharacterized protein encoded by MAPKAPK5-AS1 [Macaca thibetana thibetana]
MAFSMSLSSDILSGAPTAGRGRGCAAALSPRGRGSKGLGSRAPGPRDDGRQPPLGTGGDEDPGAGSASAGGSRLAAAAAAEAAAPGDKSLCWAPRGRLLASSPAGESGSRGRARPGGPPPGALCRGLVGPPLRSGLARS